MDMDSNCTSGGSILYAATYTVSVTGIDANQAEGYDLTLGGAGNPYTIVKVNALGNYLSIGDKTGIYDGTTLLKRPQAWYFATHVKVP